MIPRPLVSLFLTGVCACTLLACGADKPAEATTEASAKPAASAPAKAPSAEPAAIVAPPKPKGPPVTLSGVAIDPAVAGPCKIEPGKTFFEYDAATLKGPDLGALNALATCVTKGPLKGKTLEILGHADPTGDADYTAATKATSRAQAVADYLEAMDVKKPKLKVVPGSPVITAKAAGQTIIAERRVEVRLGK
jgi:peptidoglycan-associated lipoprotein